jgi:hypothetical protein
MTQHTKEPWEVWSSNSHIRISAGGKDGAVLHATRAADGMAVVVISEADARRIVACVNACAGISDKALESWLNAPQNQMGIKDGTWAQQLKFWWEQFDKMRKQCDELLEALHVALPFVEDAESSPDFKNGHVSKVIKQIRAALSEQEPVAASLGNARKAAMAIYTPPFRFERGYVFDSRGHMVSDIDGVENAVAARVRGWGRISYMPTPEDLQDEIGAMMADALNAYYVRQNSIHELSDALAKSLAELVALAELGDADLDTSNWHPALDNARAILTDLAVAKHNVVSAVAIEREECAKVCDVLEFVHVEGFTRRRADNVDCAAAIRARGSK